MEKKGEGEEEYKHVCRLCKKKYPTGKSLGGHMRSHVVSKNYVPQLDKRKRAKNEYKERSARYRAIALIDSSSKSVIEVEQEQVALCLMMLSRDCSRMKEKDGHLSAVKASLKSTQKAGNSRSFNGESSTKGHLCPFCHKVFRSGQALGGHKRSHLTGSSSQPKNHPLLIDLNLPATPVEENGDFMGW